MGQFFSGDLKARTLGTAKNPSLYRAKEDGEDNSQLLKHHLLLDGSEPQGLYRFVYRIEMQAI